MMEPKQKQGGRRSLNQGEETRQEREGEPVHAFLNFPKMALTQPRHVTIVRKVSHERRNKVEVRGMTEHEVKMEWSEGQLQERHKEKVHLFSLSERGGETASFLHT